MNNFKPRPMREGKRMRFSYYPAETGKMIKIEISHRDGGQNYFSGQTEVRGVQVIVSEVEIGSMGGTRIETTAPMSNVNARLLIAEMPRYSEKKLAAIAQAFDPLVPQISAAWANDQQAGLRLLQETARQAAARI